MSLDSRLTSFVLKLISRVQGIEVLSNLIAAASAFAWYCPGTLMACKLMQRFGCVASLLQTCKTCTAPHRRIRMLLFFTIFPAANTCVRYSRQTSDKCTFAVCFALKRCDSTFLLDNISNRDFAFSSAA